MRILYLSQLIPYPADAGPKVRIYHVMQYLAAAGHEITLLAFRREHDTEEAIDHLRKFCDEVHTVLMSRSRVRDTWELARSTVTGRSFLISRDGTAAMSRQIQDLVTRQHFDAVHADQLWMAQYALEAREASEQSKQPLTVLDQHNAVYLIPERLATDTSNRFKKVFLAQEARNMARYEVETCQKFEHVVWVTEQDRAALANLANGQGTFMEDLVIPISVDPQNTKPVMRGSQARRVTFLGGMHWPPNAEGISWFTREVWPLVRQEVPDAVLTVIGKNPPASITQVNVQLQNVEATGYVSEIAPYLSETTAFIVPLHAGGGMRVKILDAWNRGLPVVSTSIGAEGLRYKDGENLLLAEDAGEFARATISLFREPALADALSAAGRKTVEEYYDWQEIYKAWDKIYGTT